MPRHGLSRLRPLLLRRLQGGSNVAARSSNVRYQCRQAHWRAPQAVADRETGFCSSRGFSAGRMELEKAREGREEVAVPGEEESASDSENKLFSCEGVEEGFLEDAEPTEDPEGRRYLHVLTVEEVQTVLEKTRADDVQVIPVREVCEWADHLVVASGHSGRHLRGIADAVCFEVKKRSANVGDNVYPTVEGRESEEWMVVDCGSIVVHVFREDIRSEYNLEEMWRKRRPANIKDIGL